MAYVFLDPFQSFLSFEPFDAFHSFENVAAVETLESLLDLGSFDASRSSRHLGSCRFETFFDLLAIFSAQ
jgi:hypothetical protein